MVQIAASVKTISRRFDHNVTNKTKQLFALIQMLPIYKKKKYIFKKGLNTNSVSV